MKTDCPYAHTKYVNEGRYSQWVYFVMQDEVDAFPPMKDFFGPPMETLDGASYPSDPSGAFSKQSFVLSWEGKRVMGQLLKFLCGLQKWRPQTGSISGIWANRNHPIDPSRNMWLAGDTGRAHVKRLSRRRNRRQVRRKKGL